MRLQAVVAKPCCHRMLHQIPKKEKEEEEEGHFQLRVLMIEGRGISFAFLSWIEHQIMYRKISSLWFLFYIFER
jgi:hypothetical protein